MAFITFEKQLSPMFESCFLPESRLYRITQISLLYWHVLREGSSFRKYTLRPGWSAPRRLILFRTLVRSIETGPFPTHWSEIALFPQAGPFPQADPLLSEWSFLSDRPFSLRLVLSPQTGPLPQTGSLP